MFFKSLQWRLVCIFILLTIFIMTFVGYYLNKSVEVTFYNAFKRDIEQGFESWNNAYKRTREDLKKVSVYHIQEELDGNDKILFFSITNENRSYTIIEENSENLIFASSDKDYSKDDPNKFLTDILKSQNLTNAMAKGTVGDKGRLTYTDDRIFFDYAIPVVLREGKFVLYFRYDREEYIETIGQFNNTILLSSFIGILASFILGYILSKTITIPIVNIMHKARKVADGDFEQVLEVKSHDEIGELTKTFNYMARELKNTLIEISSEKNKIETILNYMTDGVIAFNIHGEVIHANPAAKKMLEIESIKEGFNEFFAKYDAKISIEEILYLESKSVKERALVFNDKYISVYFIVFTGEENNVEGIISVLQDVTEQQKLENMRREFVANVSHELRTPLTSIKSYTETLLDGALEDRETAERFLGVVNSEADRMTRLVKDLLQLSKLGNHQVQWNITDVAFDNLVKKSVESMRIEAQNKAQSLGCYVIGEIPLIEADGDRIEQVIINLLSNAIKYTPPEGKITVYVGKMYSEVYMKVADTGIGIPEADLPRIFERFYRVDKARSREMGGTGLGLSIAKEIVEAHGGSISVESQFGVGTEITVRLPIHRNK